MKYTRFKGTVCVMQGTTSSSSGRVMIKADGKTVYTSPEITKTSAPISIDINIKGCYDFLITFDISWIAIGDAGFYQ